MQDKLLGNVEVRPMHTFLGEFFADPLLWISQIVQFLLIVWGAVVAGRRLGKTASLVGVKRLR
jgi:hypothetical protein